MRMLRMGVFLAAVQIAPAATWYVNGRTGRDSNNCTSATTACRTIGHAISLASSGDSISVASGIYTENLTINVNLKLIGAHPATTIIDGGGVNRVVSILNASAQVGIAKVTIRHGVAAGGGGILNWGALRISYCTITANAAASSYSATGGGIYNSGTLTIIDSALSGNAGTTNFIYGGGIYNSGTLAITNSTLSGNAANGFTGGGGGGIYNASGTVRISNSTFSGNTGSPSGGGIYNGGTVTLQNSIVANSTSGGNCYGTVSSAGYNLSSDGTCNFNNAGDLNNTDPLLGPLQNNGGPTQTMASLPGSPVIDAGNPNGCTDSQGHLLATDQRGQPRPDAGDASGCDMGAYENQTN
ncbi:MAG TPA: choice-of-anchor Q domain-containing protein [Bryobacteraceae bacterium]|nr:choice-of-anchor Q domain-containing protein [Bryobacteraceae bacterium]